MVLETAGEVYSGVKSKQSGVSGLHRLLCPLPPGISSMCGLGALDLTLILRLLALGAGAGRGAVRYARLCRRPGCRASLPGGELGAGAHREPDGGESWLGAGLCNAFGTEGPITVGR